MKRMKYLVKVSWIGLMFLSCCGNVETPRSKEEMVTRVNEVFSEDKHLAPWVLPGPVPQYKHPIFHDYRVYRHLFEPEIRGKLDLMCENIARIGCFLRDDNQADANSPEFREMDNNFGNLIDVDFMRMSNDFFDGDSVVQLGTSDFSEKVFAINFRRDIKRSFLDGTPDLRNTRSDYVAVIVEKVNHDYYIIDIKRENRKNGRWFYPTLTSIADDYSKYNRYVDMHSSAKGRGYRKQCQDSFQFH